MHYTYRYSSRPTFFCLKRLTVSKVLYRLNVKARIQDLSKIYFHDNFLHLKINVFLEFKICSKINVHLWTGQHSYSFFSYFLSSKSAWLHLYNGMYVISLTLISSKALEVHLFWDGVSMYFHMPKAPNLQKQL